MNAYIQPKIRLIRRIISLCMFYFSVAPFALATTAIMPAKLLEAEELLSINPDKSLALARQYLSSHPLIDKGHLDYPNFNDKYTVDPQRSATNSVKALTIMARSALLLDNYDQAKTFVKQAKHLSQDPELIKESFALDTLDIQIDWQKNKDTTQALQALSLLEIQINDLNQSKDLANNTVLAIAQLKAKIYISEGQYANADQEFKRVRPFAEHHPNIKTKINYHINMGHFLLKAEYHERALSELLTAYTKAKENHLDTETAEINVLLGRLFYDKHLFDKAQTHLFEAANFYHNYPGIPQLTEALMYIGHTYYQKMKYQLAIVYFFYATDNVHIDPSNKKHIPVDELDMLIAASYTQLNQLHLAQKYLDQSNTYSDESQDEKLIQKNLIQSGIAYLEKDYEQTIEHGEKALALIEENSTVEDVQTTHKILYLAFEHKKEYLKAFYHLKEYLEAHNEKHQRIDNDSQEAFKAKQENIERVLQLSHERENLINLQEQNRFMVNLMISLGSAVVLLLIFLIYKNIKIRSQTKSLEQLNQALVHHPRTGLLNLSMLSQRLPVSLNEQNIKYEQWESGDLIEEPLSDRLGFYMIDVPMLRKLCFEFGYARGLKIEKQFGRYIQSKIIAPARLYHLPDAHLLYIVPYSAQSTDPEIVFLQVNQWIKTFRMDLTLDRRMHMGIAHYPFIRRSRTSINDKELLDILLIAASFAKKLSKRSGNIATWVNLKTIDNAPTASFASKDIRKACFNAIKHGMLKVNTSHELEDTVRKIVEEEHKKYFG